MFQITAYDDALHRDPVIRLWEEVFDRPAGHNLPALSLDKKRDADDGLLFVALSEHGQLWGTVMAGYDGHRGWLYSVAVAASSRQQGVGRALVAHAEAALTALGCMKINLQVLLDNPGAVRFYESIGYSVETHVSLGKRVPQNIG